MVITHDHEGEKRFFEILYAGRRQEADAVREQLPAIREHRIGQASVDQIDQATIRNTDRFVFSLIRVSGDFGNAVCRRLRPTPP
jgi:hypothetical protein